MLPVYAGLIIFTGLKIDKYRRNKKCRDRNFKNDQDPYNTKKG